jgi:3-deoxy-7-phosphoheptulonate synthase
MQLPSPFSLKEKYPLPSAYSVSAWRKTAKSILQRSDPRLVAIVGPCSIHDPKSALEYAKRLKELTSEIESNVFPIMRLFFEKPRTKLGWKGMLYDPHLDGTDDITQGLNLSRKLFCQITELGVPCAMEILDPIVLPYFDDLLTWGLIGARTSASQPHRQIASGALFPIGFKNDCQGNLDVAINGIATSKMPHTHIGIDDQGHAAILSSNGNPFSHLVLRGSDSAPNYDPTSIQKAIDALRTEHLTTSLIIDCSHGNSGKDPIQQKIVFESIIEQARTNSSIAGLMLESHLYPGRQPLGEDPSTLSYGISITDPCLGWEETEELFKSLVLL